MGSTDATVAQSWGPGGETRANLPEHNNTWQCCVAPGRRSPTVPAAAAADPTYFMGSEAFSGLSRLIKSFKNELAQQTLPVINTHRQREKDR